MRPKSKINKKPTVGRLVRFKLEAYLYGPRLGRAMPGDIGLITEVNKDLLTVLHFRTGTTRQINWNLWRLNYMELVHDSED